ncbi:MAG: hypothetical protein FJZ00_01115 [Candidatus Sericytochromatia bacterium]|uniref:Uncharacterized protein n=1 Tax=Candidatus Tanganyikabacteria bacterium TaxID=2961651 RepID=A0A938BLY2_9BACT|nr:hypothetical protein [Candidatus Tanganyikabacteria bacterium]
MKAPVRLGAGAWRAAAATWVFAGLLAPAPEARAQMRLYTGGSQAAQAKKNLPGESRTAAGAYLLPRYLAHPGDYELGFETHMVLASSPAKPGGPHIPQIAGLYQPWPFLELQAVVGPTARIGTRGPIFRTDTFGIGWAAGYRIDDIPVGTITAAGDFSQGAMPPGVGQPLGSGFLPGIGLAQGGELRLETLQRHALDVGFVDVGLSPAAIVASNRTGAGADVSLDLALERFTVGYTGTVVYNAINPFDPGLKTGTQPVAGVLQFNPLELQHALGARVVVGDRACIQVGYRFIQQDTYFNSWHLISGGIGFRPLTPEPTEAGTAAE